MKKSICIGLCVLMLITAPLASYKKADALGAWAIPFAVAGTFTLGGVIATTVCVAAALYGVSVIVDNWDDMAITVGNALNESTGTVKDWWNNVTESAVRNDDPVYTFEEAKASGELINFMDYYKPPKKDDDKKIDVTAPVAKKIIEILEKKYDTNIITESTLKENLVSACINRGVDLGPIALKYFDWIAVNSVYDYHLYKNIDTYIHNNYSIEKKPYLYISVAYSDRLQFDVMTDEQSKWKYLYRSTPYEEVGYIINGDSMKVTEFPQYFPTESISSYLIAKKEFTSTTKENILKHIYNSFVFYNDVMDIRLSDDVKILYPDLANVKLKGDMSKVVPVVKSNVKINTGNQQTISIKPNDLLLDTFNQNVNNGAVKSTDDLLKDMVKVNEQTKLTGDAIYDVEIDTGENETVPDDSVNNDAQWKGLFGYLADFLSLLKSIPDSIFERFKAMLTSILEAIKTRDFSIDWTNVINLPGRIVEGIGELLARIFLPNDAIVQAFVDSVMAKVGDQTGILTYPLSLVIRFLGFVMDLGESDCIIVLPSLSFMGQKLMEKTSFNFTEYVKKDHIKEIYSIYKMVVNFIMIMWVVNLARIRLDDVIKGG